MYVCMCPSRFRNVRMYDCLVVSPSPDRMMIVGGWGEEDSVEECVVAYILK